MAAKKTPEHPLDARLRRKLECTSTDRFVVVIADSWEHDPEDALYPTLEEAEAAASSKRTRLGDFEECYVYEPSPDGLYRSGP